MAAHVIRREFTNELGQNLSLSIDVDFRPQPVVKSGVEGSSKRPGRPLIDGMVHVTK